MASAEIFLPIDSVTKDDIKAMAAKFINDQDHALAAVGGIMSYPTTFGSIVTRTGCVPKKPAANISRH